MRTSLKTTVLAAALASMASLASGIGVAQAAVINSSDRGWYQSDGAHTPFNTDYNVGEVLGWLL